MCCKVNAIMTVLSVPSDFRSISSQSRYLILVYAFSKGSRKNVYFNRYTRLQTVCSLPGHSRQANKDHIPRCHRRPNGPGRLADKVVQPTTQSAEGCTLELYETKF